MGKDKVEKLPLFTQYPLLQEKLPYVHLTQLPTPVQKLDRLGKELRIGQLYIKRDDLSGEVYGGNKIRKLEFLLGDAIRAKAKEVMTFGGAGSNHALATAIYAQQMGLKSISVLVLQPNADYVRRNLLMSHYCGAELHLCKTQLERSHKDKLLLSLLGKYQMLRHKLRSGRFPYLLPTGGSNPRSTVGFVNAAFELKQQIMAGVVPEPTRIYVACGTMGTAAGLTLGLRVANLQSRVVSVRVTSENLVSRGGMIKLIRHTNSLLNSLDQSFPRVEIANVDINIRHEFFGGQYAQFTREGTEAVARMKESEKIKLDGTYTGKAFAAVMHDAREGGLRDEVVLFWDTLNSRDFSGAIAGLDYHSLPRAFHRFFEEDVQPLDANSGAKGPQES